MKGVARTGILLPREIFPAILVRTYLPALLAISGVFSGCQEPTHRDRTLLDDLHHMCFYESVDCEQLEIDARLYLDTVNLPSYSTSAQRLVLSSLPTTPIAERDRIEFFIEGPDSLPSEIDPGILNQLGWKVELVSARLEYCDHCYHKAGLAKVIMIRGPLDCAEFLWDPDDTLAVYVETVEIP